MSTNKYPLDLSIIIVNWNCSDLLVNCVDSLKNTIKKHTYEIIVVDNNSEDTSLNKLIDKFSDIKVIKNSQNYLFAYANNQGFKVAKGKYVFILNPDTVVQNCCVDKMVDFLEKSGEGVVTGTLLNPDGSIQYLHRSFPSFIKILVHFLANKLNFLKKSKTYREYHLLNEDYSQDFRLEQSAGTAIMISQKLVNQLRYLFDAKRFPLFYNDVGLCYRINKLQGKIMCLSEARITHLKGVKTKSLKFDTYSLYYSVSALKYFKKHDKWLDYYSLAILLKVFFSLQFISQLVLYGIGVTDRETYFQKKSIYSQILSERFNNLSYEK